MSAVDHRTVTDRQTIDREYARYVSAVVEASPDPVTTALEVFNTEVSSTAGRPAIVDVILDNPLNVQGPLVHTAGPHIGRPLYVVHGADGECSWFLRHLRTADLTRPVFGVNAPGWYGEPTPHEMTELAAQHLDQILKHQPEGPYTLGGYSAGAFVAVEVARQLQLRGYHVDGILMFDPMFSETTMTLPEVIGFRLRQLRRRRHPVMEPFFTLAERLTDEEVLARATSPSLPGDDPVERRFYRGLAILAGAAEATVPEYRGGLDTSLVVFSSDHGIRLSSEPELAELELAELSALRSRFLRGSEVVVIDAPHIRLFEDPGLQRELAARLEEEMP